MTKRALHNALFVAIINNNRVFVIELLRALLSPAQFAMLNLRTLKFLATVFTDAEGNERRADAVVSVMTKDGQRVIFLIEHKSTQDKALPTQLLIYQALLQANLADKVIVIVISNAQGRWRLPRRFMGEFGESANVVGGEISPRISAICCCICLIIVRKRSSKCFPRAIPTCCRCTASET